METIPTSMGKSKSLSPKRRQTIAGTRSIPMKRWMGGGRYNKVTLKKSVKSSVSVHFPNTETKHFHHDFEENLPGLDSNDMERRLVAMT